MGNNINKRHWDGSKQIIGSAQEVCVPDWKDLPEWIVLSDENMQLVEGLKVHTKIFGFYSKTIESSWRFLSESIKILILEKILMSVWSIVRNGENSGVKENSLEIIWLA